MASQFSLPGTSYQATNSIKIYTQSMIAWRKTNNFRVNFMLGKVLLVRFRKSSRWSIRFCPRRSQRSVRDRLFDATFLTCEPTIFSRLIRTTQNSTKTRYSLLGKTIDHLGSNFKVWEMNIDEEELKKFA